MLFRREGDHMSDRAVPAPAGLGDLSQMLALRLSRAAGLRIRAADVARNAGM
jgi:hypothetical protein